LRATEAAVARTRLPQIRKGRPSSRNQRQLAGEESLDATDFNDNYYSREADHQALRQSALRLSASEASPPLLMAHGKGTKGPDHGQRTLPNKGVLHKGPAVTSITRSPRRSPRSPGRGYPQEDANNFVPASIKQKFLEPQYPKSYKQL